ncbi:hypothetical protein NUSPORA_01772 [Nucleospora cyclopteri]
MKKYLWELLTDRKNKKKLFFVISLIFLILLIGIFSWYFLSGTKNQLKSKKRENNKPPSFDPKPSENLNETPPNDDLGELSEIDKNRIIPNQFHENPSLNQNEDSYFNMQNHELNPNFIINKSNREETQNVLNTEQNNHQPQDNSYQSNLFVENLNNQKSANYFEQKQNSGLKHWISDKYETCIRAPMERFLDSWVPGMRFLVQGPAGYPEYFPLYRPAPMYQDEPTINTPLNDQQPLQFPTKSHKKTVIINGNVIEEDEKIPDLTKAHVSFDDMEMLENIPNSKKTSNPLFQNYEKLFNSSGHKVSNQNIKNKDLDRQLKTIEFLKKLENRKQKRQK